MYVGCTGGIVCIWGSEDKSVESSLSFYLYMGPWG